MDRLLVRIHYLEEAREIIVAEGRQLNYPSHNVVSLQISPTLARETSLAQLRSQSAHEGNPRLDLRDLYIFVWLMRLIDRARTADDRWHLGQLELACLGGKRHGDRPVRLRQFQCQSLGG